jgi:membrane protease YdiL (CAAX protease family)
VSDQLPPPARPRWPPWYAPVAFVAAFVVIGLLVAVLGVVVRLAGTDANDPGPGFNLAATLVQDLVLVGFAFAFTALRTRPRMWHFGLRRGAFGKAVGWLALALASFYAFSALYTALIEPKAQQRIVEDLGVNENTALLVGSALLIVGVAPVAEEIFFRAFFYGALRTRLGVLTAAALDGLLFGAIHYTGPSTLAILPPLAFLGFVFCLLYEKTGSLYPVIAFHAINNAIALSVQVDSGDAVIPLAVGLVSVTCCVLVPRLQRREAPVPLLPHG